MASTIREMTFQNVVDSILKPKGVKVGGIPEEIFTDLTDDEKEQWTCNVCFLMLNEPRACDNSHLFCHTCIFAWSLTLGPNSKKCPVCRHDQPRGYKEASSVAKLMGEKRVKCPEEHCSFASPLKIFLMHSHGKVRFSNSHVDLETLRPEPGDMFMPRTMPLRAQLTHGRIMINQMLMLLQLEMQLRQQALLNLHTSQTHHDRMNRADEMLALNEQLGEVGMILGGLLSSRATPPSRSDDNGGGTQQRAAAGGRRLASRSPTPAALRFMQTADSDDDSDTSDSSGDNTYLSYLTRHQAASRINQQPGSRTINAQQSNTQRATGSEQARTQQADSRRQANDESSSDAEPETITVRGSLLNQSGSGRGAAEITFVFRRDRSSTDNTENASNDTSNTSTSITQRAESAATRASVSPREGNNTVLPPILGAGASSSPDAADVGSDAHPTSPLSSSLPAGSTTLRDAMQALNTDSNTQERVTRSRLSSRPRASNAPINTLLTAADRSSLQSATGQRVTRVPNSTARQENNHASTDNTFDAAARSSTSRSYAPQRRFRRESIGTSTRPAPVRASHDIDVANMNTLTNTQRNSTDNSRNNTGSDERQAKPATLPSRQQQRRPSLRTQQERDASPTPRPRRRSEIREELLKTRATRN